MRVFFGRQALVVIAFPFFAGPLAYLVGKNGSYLRLIRYNAGIQLRLF